MIIDDNTINKIGLVSDAMVGVSVGYTIGRLIRRGVGNNLSFPQKIIIGLGSGYLGGWISAKTAKHVKKEIKKTIDLWNEIQEEIQNEKNQD